MKFKKLLCLLCCIVLLFTLVACDRTPSTPNNGGDISDNNNVDVPEPDGEEHAFTLASQANGTFTYKCSQCDKEETFTITCLSGTQYAYKVEGSTLTFKNVSEKTSYDVRGAFHGNIVIDAGDENKFELQMSGFELYSQTYCPIYASSGDKVTVSAKKSTKNYIYDVRDAVDDSSKGATSASIYSACDLDIQGKGSLVVKSVNNNGIHTKDDLTIKNLSLQVDCKDNALKGNDSVTVESGDLVLISRTGDGIKTTNSDVSSKGKQRGTVAILGGNILIYAACDGIDSAYDVTVDESEAAVKLQIFTDKYSKYSEEVTVVSESVYYVRYNSTAYSYSLKFFNDGTDAVWHNSSTGKTVGNYRYFPITKPDGYAYVQLYIYSSTQQQGQDGDYLACTEAMAVNHSYDTIALQSRGGNLTYGWTNYTTANQGGPGGRPGGGFGGMNDGNSDKGNHSAKGIKASNRIAISAGTVTVSAYDDALHAENTTVLENGATPLGNVTVSGGSVTLRSNDDGIHADGKVSVSGGEVSVIGSYEGIEGATVEISGGNVSVVSTDDGINGTAKSGTTISISGGKLYVYAGGDGVDSNSTTSYAGISFSGGTSVIISTGQADSGIDTERGYNYTGGYVVAICKSGGMSNESTNCANFSSVGTSKTLSLQKDFYLVVDGIATVKMPVAMNALVVCLGKTGAAISSSVSESCSLDDNGVCWNVG